MAKAKLTTICGCSKVYEIHGKITPALLEIPTTVGKVRRFRFNRLSCETRGTPEYVETVEDELSSIVDQIAQWQRATFRSVTIAGAARHLQMEAAEVAESSARGADLLEEIADAIFMAIQCVDVGTGRNQDVASAITQALRDKLEKNRRRTWRAPDAHGVILHDTEGA